MASISRSYRPQTFADLTGQEGIKETLRREVALDQVAHAYLFAGPRGVGKTTLARVFAMAMNCLSLADGEPCGTCPSCTDIKSHASLDVIEMDAASNTGVDNVREAIVEHVRFVPQRKHKVYILDEAHMLSTSAWNALLKTLEEPPAYAVFILVTTELHKVPATIKSRCQRFDFQKIPDVQMVERLHMISKTEHVQIEPQVVQSIIGKSDGCLRDAETMLGQLIALGEKNITMDLASVVLPFEELGVASDILTVWSQRDLDKAMTQIADFEAQGMPMIHLMDDLLAGIRDVMRAGSRKEVADRMKNEGGVSKQLAELAMQFTPAELADMALVIMERRRDAKQGVDARFCMELIAVPVVNSLLPHGPSSAPTPNVPRVIPPPPVAPTAPPPSIQAPPEPPQQVKTSTATIAPPTTPVNAKVDEPSIVELGALQRAWYEILKKIDERSRSISFIMKLVRPVAVTGHIITLEFRYPFHLEKVTRDVKSKDMVEDVLREALKSPTLTIQGIVKGGGDDATQAVPRDMVNAIMNTFDGRLMEGGTVSAGSTT